ncbi:MAG: hypothetical protein QW348_06295 [Ignisphaera sp.]
MEFGDILKHYSSPIVKETIFEYCKDRWVAVEGVAENSRIFVRYFGKKPLKLDNMNTLLDILTKYRHLNPRTVYASLNIYGKLGTVEDLENPLNIVATTPFWDIDVEGLENWRLAIDAAKIIVDFITSRYGQLKSLYIVWSGEGAHVRLHERAIPPELFDTYSPVDVAYAIVEYVLENVKDKISELVQRSGGKVKVENLVDPKRVFTAPLSIHRKHDLVAVAIDAKNIDSFDISWANIRNFKTDNPWKYLSPGEAEALARDAIKILSEKRHRYRTAIGVGAGKRVLAEGDIDRFNVMALLQAARYYLLTGDIEKAKSFGLNRAIFYAYLKYYGRFKAYAKRKEGVKEAEQTAPSLEGFEAKGSSKSLPIEDGVETSSDGFFMIGGRVQTPEDFDRNVVRKVEVVAPFDIVWEATLKYVSRFPRHILVDPQKFYKHVYEPVRDGFMKKVVEEIIEPPPQQLYVKKDERKPVDIEPIIKHASLLKWAKKPSSQVSQQTQDKGEENRQ